MEADRPLGQDQLRHLHLSLTRPAGICRGSHALRDRVFELRICQLHRGFARHLRHRRNLMALVRAPINGLKRHFRYESAGSAFYEEPAMTPSTRAISP
jgi:hypothetical protein